MHSWFSSSSSCCWIIGGGLSLSSCSRNPPHPRMAMASSSSSSGIGIRIAVVGDVHDDWSHEEDSKALGFLQPDLVLFTGDFGNENLELVRSIAKLEIPKAAILGNHDSWKTQQFSGKKKDRVQLQLECLGEEHVGYHRLDLPSLKLSIVGGRPFSCGGDRLFRKQLLSARYGVHDMQGSARRMYEIATRRPEGHSVVFLAHNGPTGLGSSVDDICGKDWVSEGGDHGDPDLAQALSELKETTKIRIPLVVFGHMHKQLAYRRGTRKMMVVGADGTVYLNGAIVPRVKVSTNGTARVFTVIEILDGKLEKIAETWVLVMGDEAKVQEEYILFKNGDGG